MIGSVRHFGLISGPLALVLLAVGCSGADDPGSASSSGPPSPSTSTPTTPTPTPSPTPRPRTFTLAATGDVLLHERLWAQARRDAGDGAEMDFAPQLAGIEPVISAADVAICHLEVPLAAPGGPFEGYPAFSGPPQVATGLAGTPQEAQRTSMLTVETEGAPVKLALLSYTFGFNGIPYPDGETWRSDEIDEAGIVADAAAARADGADVVVAALHWGDEYVHEPNEVQRTLAPQLINSPDIDLLLGHHAHVVQPMQNVDGEWIVYGMGNLMANHAEPEGPKSEGLLTRFTFTENPGDGGFDVSVAEYLPLYQTYEPPVEVLDVVSALRTGDVGTAGKARLEQALARTTEVVESLGGADDGLRRLERS